MNATVEMILSQLMPLLFFAYNTVAGDGEYRNENLIRKSYLFETVVGKMNLNK